jgi:hypothetical protein
MDYEKDVVLINSVAIMLNNICHLIPIDDRHKRAAEIIINLVRDYDKVGTDAPLPP